MNDCFDLEFSKIDGRHAIDPDTLPICKLDFL